MIHNITSFLKKEIVLTLSGILAIASCCFVFPDSQYINYIDFHTLLILFCLMAVMAGLKDIGLFQRIGEMLLGKIHSERGIVLVLVFLCFISSMFITNDVALITFVPLALLIMTMANMENALSFIIVLMTIAANLGSMLTPIGNPQNLYLYSTSGTSLAHFLMLTLPYTLIAAVMLLLCVFAKYHSKNIVFHLPAGRNILSKKRIVYYLILFLLCLLAVAKIMPISALTVIVLLAVVVDKKSLLKSIDYGLLATFIFFFIFIGNMGRLEVFRHFLSSILEGNEMAVAILSSQIISNVPAALLLSGFTDKWTALIIGTNLGGLGTLIASMASLISYKQLSTNHPEKKGKYMVLFSIWNIIFLIVLYGAAMVIG